MVEFEYKTTTSETFDYKDEPPTPVAPDGDWELISAAPMADQIGRVKMFWMWKRAKNTQVAGCPNCGAIARTTVKLTGHLKCVGCGHIYKGHSDGTRTR